jgi:hypothetical protein
VGKFIHPLTILDNSVRASGAQAPASPSEIFEAKTVTFSVSY